jgi:hypothetical protein
MILGMSVGTFTLLHVIISLIGIASGAVVLFAMIGDRPSRGWTALFLATTVLTSATGFLFHAASFGPPHVIGVISLVLLAVALLALYGQHLGGVWRPIYVVCAVFALYLNVFVGVVQAFQKIPALNALAPKGSEPPFLAAQLVVLISFIAFGYLAVKRFHPAPGALA